jgi:hypothetical protein
MRNPLIPLLFSGGERGGFKDYFIFFLKIGTEYAEAYHHISSQ